jgi:hypothetical protein
MESKVDLAPSGPNISRIGRDRLEHLILVIVSFE